MFEDGIEQLFYNTFGLLPYDFYLHKLSDTTRENAFKCVNAMIDLCWEQHKRDFFSYVDSIFS